jgi:cell wall-associated NlpC family hydrolase
VAGRDASTERGSAIAAVPIGSSRRRAARAFFSVIVMAFAGGLVATIALPSYAFDPTASAAVQPMRSSPAPGGVQRLAVGGVHIAAAKRDGYSATTSIELAAQAAEQKRAAYAKAYASYTGPSAGDYLKNPAHPPFSLDAVYNTALQYQGVPYVFGGADPSGFDCSGFIMFVYAQYGVKLPHSVYSQDQIGTRISQSDARPGDIVVFNDDSHDGFYAGDGMILHAPYSGRSVRVQPIWTSDVHFIRLGI